MNYLSLNIRGIRGSSKKTWVQNIKKESNVNFLMLQESMVDVVAQKDVVGFWEETPWSLIMFHQWENLGV